jgi:hypothetical protein
MTRQDFKPWILEALRDHGGKAEIFQISRFIWDNYHHKISRDNKILYTWQYEIRWAALSLRDNGLIELGKFKRGVWSMKK